MKHLYHFRTIIPRRIVQGGIREHDEYWVEAETAEEARQETRKYMSLKYYVEEGMELISYAPLPQEPHI